MVDRAPWYTHTQRDVGVDVHLDKGLLVAYTRPGDLPGHVALYERSPGDVVWSYTRFREAQKAQDYLNARYRQKEIILGCLWDHES